MNKINIFALGELVIDHIFEENKYIGFSFGGSVWNTMYGFVASSRVYNIYCAALYSEDQYGKVIIDFFRKKNINLEYTQKISKRNKMVFLNIHHNNKLSTNTRMATKCPKCGRNTWNSSKKKVVYPVQSLENSYLIVDSLNRDYINIIIEEKANRNIKIIYDLNRIGSYRYLSNSKLYDLFKHVDFLHMNYSTYKFLSSQLKMVDEKDLAAYLNLKMLIITDDGNPIIIILNGKKYVFSVEIIIPKDSTGAGDAFFSSVLSDYIYSIEMDSIFILEESVNKAKVKAINAIQSLGATGNVFANVNINNNQCICLSASEATKKGRGSSLRAEYIVNKVVSMITVDNMNKFRWLIKLIIDNSVFVGSGASYVACLYCQSIINKLYGENINVYYPSEYLQKNTNNSKLFVFSYSGKSNDINEIFEKKGECVENIYLIKGSNDNDYEKNIKMVTYSIDGIPREKGFISFSSIIVPTILMEVSENDNKDILHSIHHFIKERTIFWQKFFEDFFAPLQKKDWYNVDIIYDNDLKACAYDIESKLTESGLARCTLHESKNFSHGRFTLISSSIPDIIVLCINNEMEYNNKLIKTLERINLNIVLLDIDERYKFTDCTIASFMLLVSIAKHNNFNLRKPKYHKEFLQLYRYSGKI